MFADGDTNKRFSGQGGSRRPAGRPSTRGRLRIVCRFWREGNCKKGDQCEFLHHELDGGGTSRPGPGGSRRTDFGGQDAGSGAGFSGGKRGAGHESARDDRPEGGGRGGGERWGRQRVGGGGRGGGRNYVERQRPREKTRACRYWLGGSCQKGDSCHFLHGHTTAPDIEMMTELKGHEKAVRGISLLQDTAQLYTASQDGTVRVWDCVSGQCTSTVQVGEDVTSLLCASGWLFLGLTNTIKVFQMQTGAESTLVGPKGKVHALAVSSDLLLAGCQDGSILCWRFDPSSSSFQPAASFLGHSAAVLCLETMPVEAAAGGSGTTLLISGSIDKTIKAWDLSSGLCMQTLTQHTDVVMSLLRWHSFLLSSSLDGTVKVWSFNHSPAAGLPPQFELTHSHPDPEDSSSSTTSSSPSSGQRPPQQQPLEGALAMCGSMDPSGKPVLLVAYNDECIRLFDLPAFTERGALFSRQETRSIFSAPGGLLFTGDSSGDIKVWRWLPSSPAAAVQQ